VHAFNLTKVSPLCCLSFSPLILGILTKSLNLVTSFLNFAQFDLPKHASPLTTVKTHGVYHGEEDEDGLDDDEDGSLGSLFMQHLQTKPTSKYCRPAIPKGFLKSMSQEDQSHGIKCQMMQNEQ